MRLPRSPSLFIALLAAVLILPGLFNRDFYTRGEPREALVTQSFLLPSAAGSPDWILGTGYGGAVPSKPPLTHWISAVASLPGGEVSPATARLPSALAAILALVFFVRFVGRRYGAARGAYAGIILLTCIEWFRASFTARVDMMLAATLMGGLLLLFLWAEKGRLWMLLLASLMFSLSALTKGPMAIVVPGIILVLFLVLRRESLGYIVRIGSVVFAPVLVVLACWYVAAYVQREDAFLDKVWYENVQRFLGTQEDEPHKNSALFLWISLLIGLLPWSPLLLGRTAVLRVVWRVREWRSNFVAWWAKKDSFERYSWLVLLVFLVFFSIPGSKRSVYLLPAYPFAAFLLSSLIVDTAVAAQRLREWYARGLGVVVVVLSVAAGAALFWQERLLALLGPKQGQAAFYLTAYQEYFAGASIGAWIVLLVVPLWGALLGLGVLRHIPGAQRAGASFGMAALVCLLCMAGNAFLFPPAVNGLSAKDFAAAIVSTNKEDERLYSFGTEFYGVSFYAKKPVYRYEEERAHAGLVIMNEDDVDRFKQTLGPGYSLEPLLRSAASITKVGEIALLFRFKPI